MGEQCGRCVADLEHCHGTVVQHARKRAECTEDDCVTPEAGHAFSIDCDAIGCRCAESVSAGASTHRVG